MTIPVTPTPVTDVYQEFRSLALTTMQYCTNLLNIVSGGPVPASMFWVAIESASSLAAGIKNILANQALSAELISFMQMQSAQPQWDVAADIASSLGALETMIAAMVAEFPRSGDGTMADRTLNADGTFSTTQVPNTSVSKTVETTMAWLATVS